MMLLLLLLAAVAAALPMDCSQYWIQPACEQAEHCKWVELEVCLKRGNCWTNRYGCQDRAWCDPVGRTKLRRQQCKQLDKNHCQWRGRDCRPKMKRTKTTTLWEKSNLCYSFAFNGQCEDLSFPDADQPAFCYARSDFSDCYAKFGERYLNETRPWGS